MNTMMETIKALTEIPGVSGDEHRVREAILSMVDGCAASVTTDALGNLLVFKKGQAVPKNKIVFCAHMDEIGFIITNITDDGLLRFINVGGIDSRVVLGKPVEIGEKRLYGVIGTKATHQSSPQEKEEPIPLDKLYIDIGAKDKAEAEKHVALGDRAVFYSEFRELGEDHIMARALDDRAGCALLVQLIRSDLPYDCHFAFTVQEETGCIGAVTAGYTIAPDISVVVEATTASDIGGVAPDRTVCRFGEGPAVSFMDRGTVYDSQLYHMALALAEEKAIPAQSKTGVFGGNDSRALQVARSGARPMAISLPCRYIHSPSNMLKKSDIQHTFDLLLALNGALGEL